MDLDKAQMMARQARKKKEKVHLTIRTKYAILCKLDESPLSNVDFVHSWNETHEAAVRRRMPTVCIQATLHQVHTLAWKKQKS